jgi:hypothetical protein
METNPFRARRLRAQAARAQAPLPEPPSRSALVSRSRAWVAERVAGRTWYYRAPLLLVLAWFLRGYLGDPQYSCIFDPLTLGFHEAGHAAFSLTGNRMLTVAGGTIFQILIPAVAGWYLLVKQRDPFGATVCLFWLGTSLVNAGVYAADARAQALPLVSPFGAVDVDSHDWTVMLMRVGMLSRDHAIGAVLSNTGKLTMTLALALGAWVLRVMARTPKVA